MRTRPPARPTPAGSRCSTARTSTISTRSATPIGASRTASVVADKGNGFLVTKNTYTDYQIRAEFWIDGDANSGIFIRCTDPEKVGSTTAYEVNIWDARPDPSYGTGAIVNVGKVDPMPQAAGKWNVYEITAKGSTFTVTLNGQKTVDGAQDAKFATRQDRASARPRPQGRQGRRKRQRRGEVPQGRNQAAVNGLRRG